MGSEDHLRIYQPRLAAVLAQFGASRCTAVDHGLLVLAKKSDEGSYEDPNFLITCLFFRKLNDPRRHIRLIAGGRGSRSMPRYTRSFT